MKYSFNCYGHENVTSKHKTTMEFTKDEDLSLQGDCIIGVKADFSLKELKKFIKNKVKESLNSPNNKKSIKINIIIKINGYKEEISGILNPDFNDAREIVIRKSEFISSRTLVIGADKASINLANNLKNKLKNSKNKIYVYLE